MLNSKFFILAALALSVGHAFAQETEWEPQKQVTGYVATEANYFDNLKNKERNYGAALSEAGILASYQPTRNMTIKGVVVYRPGLAIDQMVNEVNAQWSNSNLFNVKVGRFLTPLSPMNTYYYAPVNNSATLPMIISHHEFFPLNMDAVSLNGTVGNNLKLDYNLFAGGYQNSLWLKTGAMGIFGAEDEYFGEDALSFIDPNAINSAYSFGGGVHAGLKWNDYLTVGLNSLMSSPGEMGIEYDYNGTLVPVTLEVERAAYGLNVKANFKTLQLLGEFWQSDLQYSNSTIGLKESTVLKGTFVELSNTFGKITPYVRHEYHEGLDLDYHRYTGGINYRPSFETCFKLEYLYYTHPNEKSIGGDDEPDFSGLVATVVVSF